MLAAETTFERRRRRNRFALTSTSARVRRPRLSIFRSGKHIYAQIIDDVKHVTIAAASTVEEKVATGLKSTASKDAAKKVGEMVAKRAMELGISNVVFDRGGYRYHGRVQALADGAREAGLKF